jgi:septin family protein
MNNQDNKEIKDFWIYLNRLTDVGLKFKDANYIFEKYKEAKLSTLKYCQEKFNSQQVKPIQEEMSERQVLSQSSPTADTLSAQAKFEEEIRIRDAQVDYQIRKFDKFVEEIINHIDLRNQQLIDNDEGVSTDNMLKTIIYQEMKVFIKELSSKQEGKE